MIIDFIVTCAPFLGDKLPIQETAFHSWSLQKDFNVIVLGNDLGVKKFCEKYNFCHVPNIDSARSIGIDNDAILLSDGFKKSIKFLRGDAVIWANSDLALVTSDCGEKMEFFSSKHSSDFGGIGFRRDLAIWEEIYAISSVKKRFKMIKNNYQEKTTLHPSHGIDIFFWSKELFISLSNMLPSFIANGWRTDHYFNHILLKLTKNRYDISDVIQFVHPSHATGIQETAGWKNSHEHNKKLFPYGQDFNLTFPKKISYMEFTK